MVLQYAGDILWILALSIIASSTRAAWGRIDPQTTVPLGFRTDGRPGLRLKRDIALSIFPIAALAVGLLLVWINRNPSGGADQAVIRFGVRSLAAALVALAHLRWLKAALAALQAEGALKP